MITGALVQMAFLSLILGGAAIVLLGSIFSPNRADPMGMFGLPSVCSMTCLAVKAKVNNRAASPTAIASRCDNREAA